MTLNDQVKISLSLVLGPSLYLLVKTAEFWTESPSHPAHDGEEEPKCPPGPVRFCHVVPDILEEECVKPPHSTPAHAPDMSPVSSPVPGVPPPPPQQATTPLFRRHTVHNGDSGQKPEVSVHSSKVLPKFKRPPPRPPSLGSAGPPVAEEEARKDQARGEDQRGRVGGGPKAARKLAPPLSIPPSRPPVPAQSRPPPRLPPAPLRRNSSRGSTQGPGGRGDPGVKGEEAEGARDNKGAPSCPAVGDLLQLDAPAHSSHEGQKTETEEAGERTEDGKEREEDEGDKKRSATSPPTPSKLSTKRPSRPVPPPRRKPAPKAPEPEGGGGSTNNQSTGIRPAPPSAVRRPDVSLYSPQGGGAVGADPDSCSTSSSEEDIGEGGQEQEQNHR